MAYNISGAREAGIPEQEIADHLAGLHGYKIAEARQSGITDAEIVDHLAQKSTMLAKAKNAVGTMFAPEKSVVDRAVEISEGAQTRPAAGLAPLSEAGYNKISNIVRQQGITRTDGSLIARAQAVAKADTKTQGNLQAVYDAVDRGQVEEAERRDLIDARKKTFKENIGAQVVGDTLRGVDNLQATGYGLLAMGADSVGTTSIRDSMLDAYQRNKREAEENPAVIGSYKNIDSVSGAGRYAVEAVFENLAMFLPSLVTGGVGTIVARKGAEKLVGNLIESQVAKGVARNVAEKEAARFVAARTTAGSLAGAYPASAGMEIGSIYGDIYDKTGEYRPGVAAAYGSIAGALDAIPAVMALKKAFGAPVVDKVAKSLVRRYGETGLAQLGAEGVTEGIQTVLERMAVQHVDNKQRAFSQQGVDEIIDAVLKGGVAGAATGVASQAAGDLLGQGAPTRTSSNGVPNNSVSAVDVFGTPEPLAPFPDAKPGTLSSAANVAAKAQAALSIPDSMSILDGVTNGTNTIPVADGQIPAGSPAIPSDNLQRSDATSILRPDAGLAPIGGVGTRLAGSTEAPVADTGQSEPVAGARNAAVAGHPSEVVLPDNSALPAQWEVVDADQVTATLKEGKNQPRDRSRAAANAQVQGIANMPDYRRLADSPVMDVGAPTLSHDGAIVGGNGRFEGVSRAYDQGTAVEYRKRLEADAVTKGIDPASFSDMKKPVLVRRITQPFDTRALAVASNSGTSLQYSALEQAKIDGERMSGIGDIEVNDTGDVAMTADNMKNVRRALTGYNAAELGSMTDKDGLLSQEGIRRIKNALLYKAYGNSSVLSRLVESADPDLKSVMGALVRSAGSVASVRADMKDGNKPADADIASDLLSAVEILSKIKAQGTSVEQYMAQDAMFGKEYTGAAATILRFLSENIRSQKRMAGFLRSYYDGLANEDHLTGGMFADAKPVTKQERINHAVAQQQTTPGTAAEQRPTERGRAAAAPVVHAQDQHQPENAQRTAERGGAGQQDTGVTGDGTKTAPVAVEHGDQIKLVDQRVNVNPTDAQKEAGNYQKAHVQWNGLDITIENPQGSIRSGKDADGKAWEVTMPATYGYIKRTKGADGDHLDVYMGKHLQSQVVYVIDQIDHKTGKFDEHKIMLGFATLRDAERIYKRAFSDGKGSARMGAISQMSLDEFKEWIKTEDTTKPAAESLLTSYTQADIAKREQAAQNATAEDQAAVDRAVEHSRNQPLSLSAQTQERTEGSTSQTSMFTPDGRASVAAEQSGKAKADADMQAALADMGAIMRDLAGVKRIMPEDHAKLLPVLVRLFDAAFRKGYYDIREATRYVRKALSEFAETAQYAKFLPVSLMDQAAKEAAGKMPDGFFENQGLFGQDNAEIKPSQEQQATAILTPAKAESAHFKDGVVILIKAIPKNLKIANPTTGKGQYNARKVMAAANQAVEKLEALKRCLG